jgi:hypothetical protein
MPGTTPTAGDGPAGAHPAGGGESIWDYARRRWRSRRTR